MIKGLILNVTAQKARYTVFVSVFVLFVLGSCKPWVHKLAPVSVLHTSRLVIYQLGRQLT